MVKFKHQFLFPVFICLCSISHSQSNTEYAIFLDAESQVIDAVTFFKKKSSFLYGFEEKRQDTVSIYALTEYYKFGKLDSIENSQARQLIERATNRKYPKDKVLLISFRDSLMGFDSYYKNVDSMASLSDHVRLDYRKKFNSQRISYDRYQKKCRKRFKKYDFDVIYFYKNKHGYNYEPKNFEFIKISSPLRALFFNRIKNGHVLLKPDGSYFYYKFLDEGSLKLLLKNDWEPYINDYRFAKRNSLKNRNGFFMNFPDIYHHSNVLYMDESSAYFNQRIPHPASKTIFINKTRDTTMHRNASFRVYECYFYGGY